MSSSDAVSDSQTSNVSNLSLGLSQETMNQVLGAVGLSSAMGDRLLEEFHAELDDDEEEEEEGMEDELGSGDANTTLEGPSTISISRAVFLANSQVSSENSVSQFPSSSPPPAPSTPVPHTPSSTHSSWTSSVCVGGNGISPTLLHSPTPPPTSQIHLTSPLHHIPPVSIPSNPSQYPYQSPIPHNVPFSGLYNFSISLDSASDSASKTPNILYSQLVQRMFIKKNATVPITFSTSGCLPSTAFISAVAIHKQPEMIAENLQCCAKHVDEMRKKGILYPFHFIHSPMDDCRYLGDNIYSRLRISLPVSSLQRTGDTKYTALYQFPCFTSDFRRAGQLVQLIFTLESGDMVHGRATLDVRVCASPGRDHAVEEEKAWEKRGVVSSAEVVPAERRRSRKRVREEVSQCTLPPKRVCKVPSERKEFKIETFPEIISHVRECIKLLERVYMVPVGGGVSSNEPPSLPRQDSFPSLEAWLDSIGLSHYLSLLTRQGVTATFQALSLSDSELQTWGMGKRDRTRLLQEAATLQERPNILPSSQPPLLPSSQLSQNSTSTQPFLGHIEVLQIQARKTINPSNTSHMLP